MYIYVKGKQLLALFTLHFDVVLLFENPLIALHINT